MPSREIKKDGRIFDSTGDWTGQPKRPSPLASAFRWAKKAAAATMLLTTRKLDGQPRFQLKPDRVTSTVDFLANVVNHFDPLRSEAYMSTTPQKADKDIVRSTKFFRDFTAEDAMYLRGHLKNMGSDNFDHNLKLAENEPGSRHYMQLADLRGRIDELLHGDTPRHEEAARELKHWNDGMNRDHNTTHTDVSNQPVRKF